MMNLFTVYHKSMKYNHFCFQCNFSMIFFSFRSGHDFSAKTWRLLCCSDDEEVFEAEWSGFGQWEKHNLAYSLSQITRK